MRAKRQTPLEKSQSTLSLTVVRAPRSERKRALPKDTGKNKGETKRRNTRQFERHEKDVCLQPVQDSQVANVCDIAVPPDLGDVLELSNVRDVQEQSDIHVGHEDIEVTSSRRDTHRVRLDKGKVCLELPYKLGDFYYCSSWVMRLRMIPFGFTREESLSPKSGLYWDVRNINNVNDIISIADDNIADVVSQAESFATIDTVDNELSTIGTYDDDFTDVTSISDDDFVTTSPSSSGCDTTDISADVTTRPPSKFQVCQFRWSLTGFRSCTYTPCTYKTCTYDSKRSKLSPRVESKNVNYLLLDDFEDNFADVISIPDDYFEYEI
ncbi:hypothetical protein BGZ99_001829 [Dissophora globulifera]|uniref:Uncharacterized protein n=1 Tax=Dissophora globulifera TaxID=979702 RepID=A0A9P6R057_9FUNG|nr:hypothetical protein BGZ99_001829 [Dissophora globulifera]